MRIRFWAIMSLLASVLLLSACGSGNTSPAPSIAPPLSSNTSCTPATPASPSTTVNWQARFDQAYSLIKEAVKDQKGFYRHWHVTYSSGENDMPQDVYIASLNDTHTCFAVDVFPQTDGSFDVYYTVDNTHKTTRLEQVAPCTDLDCAKSAEDEQQRHQETTVLFDQLMRDRFGARWPF